MNPVVDTGNLSAFARKMRNNGKINDLDEGPKSFISDFLKIYYAGLKCAYNPVATLKLFFQIIIQSLFKHRKDLLAIVVSFMSKKDKFVGKIEY